MALSASLASADSAPRSAMTASSCRAGCRWRAAGVGAGARLAAGFLATLGFRGLGEPSVAACCTSWDCMQQRDWSLRSLAVAAGLHLIGMLLKERVQFVDMPVSLLGDRDGSQKSYRCPSNAKKAGSSRAGILYQLVCVAPRRQRTELTVCAAALRRSRLGQAAGASGFLWPSALVDTSSMSASASACRSRHPSCFICMQHMHCVMYGDGGGIVLRPSSSLPGQPRCSPFRSLKACDCLSPSAEACETVGESVARTQACLELQRSRKQPILHGHAGHVCLILLMRLC